MFSLVTKGIELSAYNLEEEHKELLEGLLQREPNNRYGNTEVNKWILEKMKYEGINGNDKYKKFSKYFLDARSSWFCSSADIRENGV